MPTFYLLIDTKFLYGFLTDRWLREFAAHPAFGGLLLKGAPPDPDTAARRHWFHAAHAGQTTLSPMMDAELSALYPDFGAESRAAIRLFGIPSRTFSAARQLVYLGEDLNGDVARRWAERHLIGSGAWVFSRVGQVLAPWWVEYAAGRLLNMHGAVLPHARGTYAIPQVAVLRDPARLREVAGATVHFIDAGIDTGALIRAERIAEPLAYPDLWALVAAVNELGNALYVRTARDIVSNPETRPVGFQVGPGQQGPNYRRRDFTPDRRMEAEAAFLAMHAAWLDATPSYPPVSA